MKIRFLASSATSVAWVQNYYSEVFKAGRKNYSQQYFKAKRSLRDNPEIGYLFGGVEGVRKYEIVNTPFSFVYRIKNDEIQILRVWDNRREPEEHLSEKL
jgi:plasmid stabilization system protein ParE